MAVCASQFVVHLLLQVMSDILSLVSSPTPAPSACLADSAINRCEVLSAPEKRPTLQRQGQQKTGIEDVDSGLQLPL